MDIKLNTFPLNNRPFLALWLAQLSSQVAINVLNIILALLVYEKTQSNTAVSLLVLAFNLPGLLLGASAGALVDSLDKKAVLVLVNFSRMLLVLAFLLTNENLFFILLLSLILSILTQFFYPSEAATIPALVGDHPQNLFRANSLFALTFYLSIVLGFLSGGPALKVFGSLYVFIFVAGMLFVAYLLVASLPISHFTLKRFFVENHQNGNFTKIPSLRRTLEKVLADLKDGFELVKTTPALRVALICLGLAQILMAVFLALAPGFAKEVLRIDVTDASVSLFGPAVIGMVLGAVVLNRFGHKLVTRRWPLIMTAMPLAGLSLIALSFTQRIPIHQLERLRLVGANSFWGLDLLHIAQMLLLLPGLFEVMVDIPCNTILQEAAWDERRGRVYGLLTTFVTGGSVLPVLFSGVIADRIGVTRVMLIVGLSILGVSLLLRREKVITS